MLGIKIQDLGLVFLAGCFISAVKIYDWVGIISDVRRIYRNPVVVQARTERLSTLDPLDVSHVLKWSDASGREYSKPQLVAVMCDGRIPFRISLREKHRGLTWIPPWSPNPKIVYLKSDPNVACVGDAPFDLRYTGSLILWIVGFLCSLVASIICFFYQSAKRRR
jgi:hypothetical protein